MRLGVIILPEQRWSQAQHLWRRAENLGLDHAWTYDHMAWRSLRDSPWFGAVPTLAAAALVTERIRLGTLVSSANFRHPVPFAKELISLDDLSGGRFTLGVGAGSNGWDATMLGQEPWSGRERAARFAEFVELLDLVLREQATSWNGHYYSADEARTYPGCVQQPRIPFAVAATGPRGMRLAATYGHTWVTTGDRRRDDLLGPIEGAKVVGEQIHQLEDACAAADRDPETLARLVVTGPILLPGLDSPAAFEDALGRYEEAGVTDFVVHWPRTEEPFAGDRARFEAALAAVTPDQ
jgi:alkanesulfonate monooxygenase SsuD/methylene tetrahydromethanopterin reductase-like flavin-dependent oxidoreductase (luciferase family)